MGRLGYQSDAQATLAVSYNSLESYGASLQDALTRPYPPYEAIGIRNPGGDYNQLATSLLQIENEFYGTIRPKRVIRPGERPLHALRERGVEYVEVRCMDLDPFEPVGIDAPTMRFLDVFLLHCLLADSPPDTPDEIAALARNQHRTAARGREPGLDAGARRRPKSRWPTGARELLEECAPIAAALDAAHGGSALPRRAGAARHALQQTRQRCRRRACWRRCTRDFDGSLRRASRARSRSRRASTLLAAAVVGRTAGALRGHGRATRWPSSSASRPPTRCPSRSTARPTCRRSGWASDRRAARRAGPWPTVLTTQLGAAPWVPVYTAYSDWLAAMNRRLRFGPPKQTLPQTSGSRMRPISLPCGVHTVTPL